MHMALWVLTGVSLLGAAVSLMRPSEARTRDLAGAVPVEEAA